MSPGLPPDPQDQALFDVADRIIDEVGYVTRALLTARAGVPPHTASRALQELEDMGYLECRGKGPATHYVRTGRPRPQPGSPPAPPPVRVASPPSHDVDQPESDVEDGEERFETEVSDDEESGARQEAAPATRGAGERAGAVVGIVATVVLLGGLIVGAVWLVGKARSAGGQGTGGTKPGPNPADPHKEFNELRKQAEAEKDPVRAKAIWELALAHAADAADADLARSRGAELTKEIEGRDKEARTEAEYSDAMKAGAACEADAARAAGDREREQAWEAAVFHYRKALGVRPTSSEARAGAARAASHAVPDRIAVDLGGGVSMQFVRIRAGSFLMGSDTGPTNERPAHAVEITRDFWMAETETTQAQWKAVLGMEAVPTYFKGDSLPEDRVSWNDACAFAAKLNEKHGDLLWGRTAALPTEAEWEYACRAGSKGRWCFGDEARTLADYGWTSENSHGPQDVQRKKPNAWGLYDMHGNAWEWCADYYANSYAGAKAKDPAGPATGQWRVLRGGSWQHAPDFSTSSTRFYEAPDERRKDAGVRIVLR